MGREVTRHWFLKQRLRLGRLALPPQYLSGGRVAALHRTEVSSRRQGARAQQPPQRHPLGFPTASLSLWPLCPTHSAKDGGAWPLPISVSSGCCNKNTRDSLGHRLKQQTLISVLEAASPRWGYQHGWVLDEGPLHMAIFLLCPHRVERELWSRPLLRGVQIPSWGPHPHSLI